jgi:hypothetical protein
LFLQDNGRQQFVVRGRVNCDGAGGDKARDET